MKKVLALLIVCTALTVSCAPLPVPLPTPTPPQVDLLSDKTCNKPCVLGITPGKTATDYVIAMVQNNKLLPDCQEHDLRSQLGRRGVECPSEHFTIVFDGGLVSWLTLTPPGVTVEQLISRYGTPDAASGYLTTRPDEPARTGFIMLFNQVQAEVGLADQSGRDYTVEPDTQVDAIIFNSAQEQAGINSKIHDGWHGYGVYSP